MDSVSSQIERGPVRMVVSASPKSARLSDEVKLTITITSEPDVQIHEPPFGDAIGDFVVRDYRKPLPRQEDGRNIRLIEYTLEPVFAGKLSILPVAVRFTDNREKGDGKEHTIESEGLTVEVKSVIADQAVSLDALEPDALPQELPQTTPPLVWWLTGGAAVLLIAVVAVLLLRRKREEQPLEKQYTPRELAYLELQAIIDNDLAASDVKLFYVELTGVVRRYIERSTGIQAAEETTEEFLRDMNSSSRFASEDRQRLQQFLESADLVKFAGMQPRATDIEESFDRAKAFIGLELEAAAA